MHGNVISFGKGHEEKTRQVNSYQITESRHYTKVFDTHHFYEGGEGFSRPLPMISQTVDSTNFNNGRPLGLSMRGKKLVELMI